MPTPSAARFTRRHLSRLRDAGICYNAFHTTSICSPTRAALLTGRNHHRVGNGTIAERAWTSTATRASSQKLGHIAEVLHHYGYKSAAFGKWHNTPANQTTAMGPFDRWPTGHGFDYFYGFLAGETSQWEPRLYENRNPIEPPHSEKYHLTRGHGRQGGRLDQRHQAFRPTSRSSCTGLPGRATVRTTSSRSGPTGTKGKFDDGWDAYRRS